MTTTARLISVNVGLPRDLDWKGTTVHTAIGKQPVQGRVAVRRLNIEGDGQGDLAGHGGEHRAIMVYQLGSYRYWETFLGRHDFQFGQFSENFTIEGLADDEVCIGDRYRIGTALLEVTQPRVTCYRIGIRMNDPNMPSLAVAHRRPGFYLRVLEEGYVAAGDAIAKVAEGPERMSVAEVDGLLYLPGPRRDRLEQALRVPALSKGWQESLQAILDRPEASTGNPGLTAPMLPLAWPGFRPVRVIQVKRESIGVLSLTLAAQDAIPLPQPLPGQFIVLKLSPAANGEPLLRNYSLSGAPSAGVYRVSVKLEKEGVGSRIVHEHIRAGHLFEISAPRGTFTLKPGTDPVILMSAGIGVTPLLAMLHALAASGSQREIWWLYGARNGEEHSFAAESAALIAELPCARAHIAYSRPGPTDRLGVNHHSVGRLDSSLLANLKLPREADCYLCGPASFLSSLTAALQQLGVDPHRIFSEVFGSQGSLNPDVASGGGSVLPPAPVPWTGTGPAVSFTRSGVTVPWDSRFASLLELAETSNVPVRRSCRTGVCHNCESAMIDGSVIYEPQPLQPPAEGNVLICYARPLRHSTRFITAVRVPDPVQQGVRPQLVQAGYLSPARRTSTRMSI